MGPVFDLIIGLKSLIFQIECMKADFKRLGSVFLGFCASIGCAGLVHAQVWVPITVGLGPVCLVTTGNVTCVEYTWGLLGCQDMVSTGPVIRDGSNFQYNFDLEEETGVACPLYAIRENTTVALGTLAPGGYTLTTTSWGVPIATNSFTVPTNSTTTLQPVGFGADGSFNMQLTGVTNVSYVLQCSTDFVNWTSLSTNSVGQPVKDPAPTLSGSRFYRVQILETVTVLGSGY
jgi:hypothetical protein